MLIHSAQQVRNEGESMDDISLYGQERNPNTWAIGQMNTLLHDLYDAEIATGDTVTVAQRAPTPDDPRACSPSQPRAGSGQLGGRPGRRPIGNCFITQLCTLGG